MMRRQKGPDKKVQSERRKAMRKEKSKEAARCRRGKEGEVFTDLVETLPLPDAVRGALDKSSIIRLAINYMKARHICQNAPFLSELDGVLTDCSPMPAEEIADISDSAVLILSPSEDIVYVTENIQKLLGICQYDVIGHTFDTFIHPADWADVESSLRPNVSNGSIGFMARFKCTLSPRGRVVNAKSAMYKTLRFNGQRMTDLEVKPGSTYSSYPAECIILTATPLELPSLDQPLDNTSFTSKHSLDMQFIDCDSLVTDLTRYPETYIKHRSLFDFVHTSDIQAIEADFKTLYRTEQVITGPYRFLTFGGGYVRTITQASLVNDLKTGKPAHILCLHHVISQIEESEVVMAEVQMIHKETSVKIEASLGRSQCSGLNDDLLLKSNIYDCTEGDEYDNIFNTTASCFVDADDDLELGKAASGLTAGSLSSLGSIPEAADMSSKQGLLDLEALIAKLDNEEVDLSDDLFDLPGLADEEDDVDESYYQRAPYIPMDDIDDWIKEERGISCSIIQSSLPDLDSDSLQYRRPCSAGSTSPSIDRLKAEQLSPSACCSGAASDVCSNAVASAVQSPTCSDLFDVLNISMGQTSPEALEYPSYDLQQPVANQGYEAPSEIEDPLHRSASNNRTTNAPTADGSPQSHIMCDSVTMTDQGGPRSCDKDLRYFDYHCTGVSPSKTTRSHHSPSEQRQQRQYIQSHRKRKLHQPPYHDSVGLSPTATSYTLHHTDQKLNRLFSGVMEDLPPEGGGEGGGGGTQELVLQSTADDSTAKMTLVDDLIAVMETNVIRPIVASSTSPPPLSFKDRLSDTESSSAHYRVLADPPEWSELSELDLLRSNAGRGTDYHLLADPPEWPELSEFDLLQDSDKLSNTHVSTDVTYTSPSHRASPSLPSREYEASLQKRPKSLLVSLLQT